MVMVRMYTNPLPFYYYQPHQSAFMIKFEFAIFATVAEALGLQITTIQEKWFAIMRALKDNWACVKGALHLLRKLRT